MLLSPAQAANLVAIYCDGGILGPVNRSLHGGTWAWCAVDTRNVRCIEQSGIVTPQDVGLETVTNNVTEMIALLNAIEAFPSDWQGTLYSDSDVTLGRIFRNWKLRGLPDAIVRRVERARHQHTHVTGILVGGHPTPKDLANGYNPNGQPVSVHNEWCHNRCDELAGRLPPPKSRPEKMQQVEEKGT